MMPSDQSGMRPLPGHEEKGRRGERKGPKGSSRGRRDFKIPLIIAIVLGVFGALLILGSGGDESASGPQTYVIRATRDITAWTNIGPGDVEAVAMDVSALFPEGSFRSATEELFIAASPEAAIESMNLGEGVFVRHPLRIGQLVYKADLAFGSLAVQDFEEIGIGAGDRIISVEALPARAAGGVLRPGDRVDIVVADATYEVARVILADVPILSVTLSESALEAIYSNQIQDPALGVEDLKPADPLPGIYTIAVPASHAEEVLLFAGRNQAGIFLSLRHNAADDPTRPVLDENGRQALTKTVSVLEVLCPPSLVPETGSVFDEPVPGELEEGVTIELPDVCLREILELQADLGLVPNPIVDDFTGADQGAVETGE